MLKLRIDRLLDQINELRIQFIYVLNHPNIRKQIAKDPYKGIKYGITLFTYYCPVYNIRRHFKGTYTKVTDINNVKQLKERAAFWHLLCNRLLIIETKTISKKDFNQLVFDIDAAIHNNYINK